MTHPFPKILGGRYEVRELIGRGGMAEVHLGYDQRLSRTVAIKLLRSDMASDPTFLARFRREAQSAAALNHPAIVAVYDSGEEQTIEADGTEHAFPYIVMEYVEGHTVRDLVTQGEAVPIDEAAEIVTGVLDALEYSHRAGIVHRDIKPGNIMLTTTGAVKVMDFGIARAMEDSAATVTQTHSVVGTAQYLSPEQARGEVVDSRSDLYSTGCLLYELLTGVPPFQGDSAVSIAYQHVREVPKAPSSIALDIPESLDRVVLKALAKNRDDRYQDAAQMRSDLLMAARGLAVNAPAVGSWAATTTVLSSTPTEATTTMSSLVPAPPVEEEEPEEETSRKWVWILIVAFLALVALFIGLLASGVIGGSADATPTATPSPTAAAIPDVTGMTESEAQAALEEAGFVYQRGDDVSSDMVDEGLVVSTEPADGLTALLGSTVTVHLSSGSAMVDVPDVTDMSQEEAEAALEEVGLTVGDTSTEDAAGVDEGDVVRTDPVSGTSVQRGAEVSLVLSTGMTTVPDGLVGSTQEEARAALEAAGLTVGNVTTEDSNEVEADSVLSTSPSSGESVKNGSTVSIVVASGKITVPDGIVGSDIDSARDTLNDLGFQVNTSYETTDDESLDGIVTEMSLAAGTTVDSGTTIELTVGSYEEATATQPTEEPATDSE